MLSLIARGLYDCIYYCCVGRQQQLERKTTREILDDLEELAEEEIGRVLSHLAATRRPRLSCC
jgi:hypothetical protein